MLYHSMVGAHKHPLPGLRLLPLIQHQLLKRKDFNETVTEIPCPKSRLPTCSLCQKTFNYTQLLQVHLMGHFRQEIFSLYEKRVGGIDDSKWCQLCGFKTKERNDFTKHLVRRHAILPEKAKPLFEATARRNKLKQYF